MESRGHFTVDWRGRFRGMRKTVIELIRLLTDDAFREAYLKAVREPLLQAFWRNEWPKAGERNRDGSIKAVLNKLGAFVAYESIRNVVGQGVSTVRPRDVMDRGDLLARRPVGRRRRQRLVVRGDARRPLRDRRRRAAGDPARAAPPARPRHRRGTSARHAGDGQDRDRGSEVRAVAGNRDAVARWAGRAPPRNDPCQYGLARPAATGLGQPAPARRPDPFAPITVEQLAEMRPTEVLLKLPGPDGRRIAYGGEIERQEAGDSSVAASIIRASDQHDARRLAKVEAEVWRRSGGGTRLSAASGAGGAESWERQVDA